MRRSRAAWAGVVAASATAAGSIAIGVLGVLPPVSGTPAPVARVAVAVQTYPSEADYCYVEAMIVHHAQALEMSDLVLAADGISDRVRALAEFILADQSREIEAMRAWSDAWTESAAAPPASGAGHAHGSTPGEPPVSVGCSHGDHAVMAGMATPDQLASLSVAQGDDAQRLFLGLMIAHHEGALVMAEGVIRGGSNAFVRSSAKHVMIEQKREIDAMTTLLAGP